MATQQGRSTCFYIFVSFGKLHVYFLSCKTLSCMRSLKFLRNENIALTKFYIDGQMLVCGIIGHSLEWGLHCRQLASMGRRKIFGLSTSSTLFCQPCLISRGNGSINFPGYAPRSIHIAWPCIKLHINIWLQYILSQLSRKMKPN